MSKKGKTINIKPLKIFALNKLPNCSLRYLLLIEEEKLDVQTFLARMPIWLKLIRGMEDGRIR